MCYTCHIYLVYRGGCLATQYCDDVPNIHFFSSHSIQTCFLQQPITKLVPSHLDLKEEEIVNAKNTLKKVDIDIK